MKRRVWTTLLSIGVAALVLGTLTAATQGASSAGPVLTIRHSFVGCHVWAYGGGVSTTQVLVLHEGQSFTVENRDNCSHELVQTGGPAVAAMTNLSGAEGTMIEALRPGVRVTLSKAGVYRFATVESDALRYGYRDDLYGGFSKMSSRGPDNRLELVVRVWPDRNHLPE
jgi:hypothetical protein